MTKVRDQILGTKKSFDICCASYEFVFIGPKRLKQHQFVKKGIASQIKKDFGLFFVISNFKKLKGQLLRVQKVCWQLLWKFKDHFCNTWEVVENTIFWKRRRSFQWKKLIKQILSFYRVRKTSCNNFERSTSCFDNHLQVTRPLLQDLKCCWRHKTLSRRRQPFQWRTDFGQFFLVRSNGTNLKARFVRDKKVFWHLLWTL